MGSNGAGKYAGRSWNAMKRMVLGSAMRRIVVWTSMLGLIAALFSPVQLIAAPNGTVQGQEGVAASKPASAAAQSTSSIPAAAADSATAPPRVAPTNAPAAPAAAAAAPES